MMRNKAAAFIKEHSLFTGGERVTVAVSGGADSVALLHFLFTIREEYGLTLSAAHLNHGLRGEESMRDERFVLALCAKMEIPLSVRSEDIALIAEQSGEGIEECGRNRRYAFLGELAQGGLIATAHTLSDSAETFFINLLRGTGIRGLCGIPPKRGNIIRPLLRCTREEILDYCRENALDFVEDSSNADDRYLRNRIRHGVIPALESVRGSSPYPAFARLLDSLAEDERYLSELAERLVTSSAREGYYDAAEIGRAAEPVAKRALRRIAEVHAKKTPEAVHIEALYAMLRTGGQVRLPGKITARVAAGRLDFPSEMPKKAAAWSVPCVPGEWAETPVGRIRLVREPSILGKAQFIHKKLLQNTLDCGKIAGKIQIRNRREGDRIRLPGRKCTKTLKNLFGESGLPPERRGGVLFLEDAKGLVWVQGFGVCERCAPDEATRFVYRVEVENEEENGAGGY